MIRENFNSMKRCWESFAKKGMNLVKSTKVWRGIRPLGHPSTLLPKNYKVLSESLKGFVQIPLNHYFHILHKIISTNSLLCHLMDISI